MSNPITYNSTREPVTDANGGSWLPRLLLPAGNASARQSALLLALVAVPLVAWFLLARGAFDFDCYWVGTWAVRDGKPTQMYATLDTPNAQGFYDLAGNSAEWRALADAHLQKSHQLWGFIYPPPAAALFLPFTYLPRTVALLGWRLLNLTGYLAGVLALLYLARRQLSPLAAQVLLFLALASPPLLVSLALGQMTPLVFLTAVAGLYFLQQKRPVASGVCLALGTLLKLSPALFVVWLLARKQFRVVGAWAAGMIGLSAITVLLTGTAAFQKFLGHCLPLLSRGAISDTNIAAVGLAGRMLGLDDPHSGHILLQDTRLTLFKLVFYGLVVLVTVAAFWKRADAETAQRQRLEYALVNMVTLLLSPITWGHHLMTGVLTLLVVVPYALERRQTALVGAAGVAYLLMLQNRDLPWTFLPVGLGAGVSLLGITLLWGVSCVALIRSDAEAGEESIAKGGESMEKYGVSS